MSVKYILNVDGCTFTKLYSGSELEARTKKIDMDMKSYHPKIKVQGQVMTLEFNL